MASTSASNNQITNTTTNSNTGNTLLPNPARKRKHEYALQPYKVEKDTIRVHTIESLEPRGRVLQTWTPCRGPTCCWYNNAHFGFFVRLPQSGEVVSAIVHQGPGCADRRDGGGGSGGGEGKGNGGDGGDGSGGKGGTDGTASNAGAASNAT